MRGIRKADHEEVADLDLAPMLDMIVALISVLLVTFSFYQTAVIEAAVPQPVNKVSEKKDKPSFRVFLEIEENRRMRLLVKKERQVVLQQKINALGGKLDFVKLKTFAKSLRQRFPEVLRMEVLPADDLSYEEVIEAIDQVKSPDDKSLYKDVVFSNVFKG